MGPITSASAPRSRPRPSRSIIFPGSSPLRAVAAEIRLPAFAIGGINAENLAAALSTGLSRIAASAAITSAPDPAEAARQLLAALGT